MDHAVALVQAYLQLNGYFTSAEYPIIAGAGRKTRSITDIDILAFRFPSNGARPAPRRRAKGLDITEIDPGLGIHPTSIDVIIGEVKEGRVGINSAIRDAEVLKTVISRFSHGDDDARIAAELLENGEVILRSGYSIRLVVFASFPPGAPIPPCRIISLGHVVEYLQGYVRKHWNLLRHVHLKDPAFGFLLLLEKARRGAAGRRGTAGVEVVRRGVRRR